MISARFYFVGDHKLMNENHLRNRAKFIHSNLQSQTRVWTTVFRVMIWQRRIIVARSPSTWKEIVEELVNSVPKNPPHLVSHFNSHLQFEKTSEHKADLISLGLVENLKTQL